MEISGADCLIKKYKIIHSARIVRKYSTGHTKTMWIHQDGCPAHTAWNITEFLIGNFNIVELSYFPTQ